MEKNSFPKKIFIKFISKNKNNTEDKNETENKNNKLSFQIF